MFETRTDLREGAMVNAALEKRFLDSSRSGCCVLLNCIGGWKNVVCVRGIKLPRNWKKDGPTAYQPTCLFVFLPFCLRCLRSPASFALNRRANRFHRLSVSGPNLELSIFSISWNGFPNINCEFSGIGSRAVLSNSIMDGITVTFDVSPPQTLISATCSCVDS